ncbi:hypothetical protein VTN00DRAFT_9086 [Thermoascus crustaceus]|uniref:uncharacterized protein n=1 Tax=Thermoascus crustaceus TaxID=5088 RepID=UPI0037443E4D
MSDPKVVGGKKAKAPAGRAQTSFQPADSAQPRPPETQHQPSASDCELELEASSASACPLPPSLFLAPTPFFSSVFPGLPLCLPGSFPDVLYIVPCELDSTASPSDERWRDMSTRAVVF